MLEISFEKTKKEFSEYLTYVGSFASTNINERCFVSVCFSSSFFFDFEQEYEISMRNLKFVKLPYLVCIHIMNDWNYGEENWVVKFRGNK